MFLGDELLILDVVLSKLVFIARLGLNTQESI
jgi:hypothetical protein